MRTHVSLFWLAFHLLRFNEFGVDGGPAAKEVVPKFTAFKQNLSSKLGVELPNIDVRPFCSFLLFFSCYTVIFYQSDLSSNWNYYMQARQLAATIITSKALGGFLFVFGSSFGAYILVRIFFLVVFSVDCFRI